MIYVNKDTGDRAIIVKRFQGVLYLKYISGIYEGSIFPIYSNLLNDFWIKEGLSWTMKTSRTVLRK